MIIAKAPLRISLGGGGTDIPAHYERNGGVWFSLAIDKYIYVALNKRFDGGSLIRWSKHEDLNDHRDTSNPLLAALFARYDLPFGLEFTSLSDIPSGTGLGSSGTFSIASLAAIRASLNLSSSPEELAREATLIELNDLNGSGGLQDQYISAYGGLRKFEVDKQGVVVSEPLGLPAGTDRFFAQHILLVYTSVSRSSETVLSSFSSSLSSHQAKTVSETIVPEFRSYSSALIAHDFYKLGTLLDQYWEVKRQADKMSNKTIGDIYDFLKSSGMIGGKLVGAGGGGFILAVAEDISSIKSACEDRGIKYVEIQPDYSGVRILERKEFQWV